MPILQTIMKGSSFLPAANQEAYRRVEEGEALIVYREPDNQHDPNAVRVCNMLGVKLAYVAKEDAAQVAAAMDAGFEVSCKCIGRPKIELSWTMPGTDEEEDEESLEEWNEIGADEAAREKEWSNE